MVGLSAINPGFKNGGNGMEKAFDAFLHLQGMRAGHHRRQCRKWFLAGYRNRIGQSKLHVMFVPYFR
jgi:hypothetical protein